MEDEKIIVSLFAEISRTRKDVFDRNLEFSTAFLKYSKIIGQFLDLEVRGTEGTSISGYNRLFNSLRILEGAKESGGKLRALMSASLGRNSKISHKELAELVDYKAGVDRNLNSFSLTLNSEQKKLIEEFQQSTEWEYVNDTFFIVLEKSLAGGFDRDPLEFFTKISAALEIIEKTIEMQRKVISSTINSGLKKAQ